MNSIIENIIDLAVIVGMLAPIIIQGIKLLQAHTTDKRIKVLESYALCVVQTLEQNANLAGGDKKKLALEKLASYINKSPLNLKVTDTQLSDLIESAVSKLDKTSKAEKIKSVEVEEEVKTTELSAEQQAKLESILATAPSN